MKNYRFVEEGNTLTVVIENQSFDGDGLDFLYHLHNPAYIHNIHCLPKGYDKFDVLVFENCRSITTFEAVPEDFVGKVKLIGETNYKELNSLPPSVSKVTIEGNLDLIDLSDMPENMEFAELEIKNCKNFRSSAGLPDSFKNKLTITNYKNQL